MVLTVKTGCNVAPVNSGGVVVEMKYEHNEVHDKTVGDILDGNRPTTTTADAICRHMAGLVDKTQPYHPTIADAFYVYNADLQKCVTVSIEQDDCIVDITIHNELDIDTARVFCEKLSSFLRSFGGEK